MNQAEEAKDNMLIDEFKKHFFPMTWAQARKEGKEIEKKLGIL